MATKDIPIGLLLPADLEVGNVLKNKYNSTLWKVVDGLEYDQITLERLTPKALRSYKMSNPKIRKEFDVEISVTSEQLAREYVKIVRVKKELKLKKKKKIKKKVERKRLARKPKRKRFRRRS